MLEMIRNSFRRLKDQEGATAVEYGIMVAAIAAVIVTVVFVLGSQVKAGFDDTCSAMDGKTSSSESCPS